MSYGLSKTSKSRLEGVHPFIIDTIDYAIKHEDCPDDFGIPSYGGLRTPKTQKRLYDKGRTLESLERGEKPVTYVDGITKESNHQMKMSGFGEAFDNFIYDHFTHKASWNVERLTKLAEHILKCSEIVKANNLEYKDLILKWGGNWKRFKDYPHFQIERMN